MAEYEIRIEWIQAWFDGCWSWQVIQEDIILKEGTSQWRWSGLWAAKRFARRHAKGKIPAPDNGSRQIRYTVGG